MACYHFTLKSDKKADGSQVSATSHVDYVNREGKYKNIDLDRDIENQLFKGNVLYASGQEQKQGKIKDFLYKSQYGSIAENENFIETSSNASVETLYVALALAMKKYGNKINAQGSNEFKAKLIIGSVEMNLPINFADPEMEKQRIKLQEEIDNGKRQLRKSGGTGKRTEKLSKPYVKRIGCEAPPQRRHRLQHLSVCGMVQYAERTELLLPSHVSNSMDNKKTYADNFVRRDLSSTRKIDAEKIADEILTRKNSQVHAASHVDYINRDEKFAYKGGCVFKGHHLPKWADDSPKKFFKAADLYEGVGYSRYKEIEFALPNELNLDQQKEIIDEFLDRHLKDFYYAYAVHDKDAVMGNGERNTHVHIMFSERKIDKREKNNERTLKEFFSRPSKSKGQEVGGCRKDPKWNGRNRAQHLCEMRKDFALIQNTVLEKYSHDVRVDHRSLKVQREDALQRGDVKLAELLDRIPEKHLGPEVAAQKNHTDVIELQKYRAFKAEHRQLLFAADMLEASIEKEEIAEQIGGNMKKATTISQQDAFKTVTADDQLHKLKEEMITALRDISAMQKVVIWNDQALNIARESCMTTEERLIYVRLKKFQEERFNLKQLQKNLTSPPSWDHEACNIYNHLKSELVIRDQELEQLCKDVGKKMESVSTRLYIPLMQKKVQEKVNSILYQDKPMKDMLKKATIKLNTLVPRMQHEIEKIIQEQTKCMTDSTHPKTKFTAQEVSLALQATIKSLDIEINKRKKVLGKLSSRIISLPRAQEMAKDIFAKGAYKKLREKKQLIKKELFRIEAAKTEYREAEKEFLNMKKPHWYQKKDAYTAEADRIANMKAEIIIREQKTNGQLTALDTQFEHLEEKCNMPAAQKKIPQITLGIMNKNKPILQKYEDLREKQATSLASLKNLHSFQNNVQRQMQVDRGKNISYHIAGVSGGKQVEAITKALSGDEKMARLIARFEDEEEIYDGMTVLDKKLIQRDHDLSQ